MKFSYIKLSSRVHNYLSAWTDPANDSVSIRIKKGSISYKEITELMQESLEEMKLVPDENYMSSDQIKAYVIEWSFYIHLLALMKHVPSDAKNRHILSNMHLRHFGFSVSDKNAQLKSLLFYSPEPSFQRKRLYLGEDTLYSEKNLLLAGKQNTYLDHHERLFAEIETLVASCIREHIVPQQGKFERSIEKAIYEEIGLSNLLGKFHFRLIISLYIYIVDKKYRLRGPKNHETLDTLLLDLSLPVSSLRGLLDRHWIWTLADSTGEISLFNRGIVNVPEMENAFFFSISRVWGLWVVSSSDSKDIKHSQGINYRSDVIRGVGGLQGLIGEKINNYLMHTPDDRELFYPYAKKLAFHPDMDLKDRPTISNKEMAANKWKKIRKNAIG